MSLIRGFILINSEDVDFLVFSFSWLAVEDQLKAPVKSKKKMFFFSL